MVSEVSGPSDDQRAGFTSRFETKGKGPATANQRAMLLLSITKAAGYAESEEAVAEQERKVGTGVKLPPVGSYQTVQNDIAYNATHAPNNLIVLLSILSKLSRGQADVLKSSTEAAGLMATTAAKEQFLAADEQYTSDMKQATAIGLQGWGEIIGGIANVFVGVATFLTAFTPVGEALTAKLAAGDAETAESVTEGADAGAGDESIPEEEGDMEMDNLSQTRQARAAQAQVEKGDQEVAAGAERTDEQRAKLARDTQKAGAPPKSGTAKAAGEGILSKLSKMDYRKALIDSFSGLINGISSTFTGSYIKQNEMEMQILAAAAKQASSLNSATATMASELSQAFNQLLGTLSENLSKELEMIKNAWAQMGPEVSAWRV